MERYKVSKATPILVGHHESTSSFRCSCKAIEYQTNYVLCDDLQYITTLDDWYTVHKNPVWKTMKGEIGSVLQRFKGLSTGDKSRDE